jgi:hypothetical protein
LVARGEANEATAVPGSICARPVSRLSEASGLFSGPGDDARCRKIRGSRYARFYRFGSSGDANRGSIDVGRAACPTGAMQAHTDPPPPPVTPDPNPVPGPPAQPPAPDVVPPEIEDPQPIESPVPVREPPAMPPPML